MSDPYLGEIKIVSFGFPPKGWATCNGQLMPINQNQALYSVLGTMYGGDGVTTFALPNLQNRTPISMGNGFTVGSRGGEASHQLTVGEMPAHNHPAVAQATTTSPGNSPANALWAAGATASFAMPPNTTMSPNAVSNVGSNQPHENQAPYLVLNFVIALQGVFPSRP